MSEAPTPANRPPKPVALCPECGARFVTSHPLYTFCTPAHKRAWNNRMLKRGGSLMLLMQAWRQGRHKKGDPLPAYALALLCAAIDEASAEDRAARRPSALEVLRNRYRTQGLGGIEAAPKPSARASGRVRLPAQETSSPA